ncbi:hypothetical protein GCM10010350_73930 [Streptomyces galilaeus]|nr:hypothetical protein GCM10010350_73930 [Streptomyces galilaeus]
MTVAERSLYPWRRTVQARPGTRSVVDSLYTLVTAVRSLVPWCSLSRMWFHYGLPAHGSVSPFPLRHVGSQAPNRPPVPVSRPSTAIVRPVCGVGAGAAVRWAAERPRVRLGWGPDLLQAVLDAGGGVEVDRISQVVPVLGIEPCD